MAAEVLYRNADPEDLSGIAELFLAAFPESIEHYVGHPIGPNAIEDAFAIALGAELGPSSSRRSAAGSPVTPSLPRSSRTSSARRFSEAVSFGCHGAGSRGGIRSAPGR